MATPHISAKEGDFAKTVLMPGDPLRSKFIAETFLENPVLVNNVRGVQGYTGTYKGTKVELFPPEQQEQHIRRQSKPIILVLNVDGGKVTPVLRVPYSPRLALIVGDDRQHSEKVSPQVL